MVHQTIEGLAAENQSEEGPRYYLGWCPSTLSEVLSKKTKAGTFFIVNYMLCKKRGKDYIDILLI